MKLLLDENLSRRLVPFLVHEVHALEKDGLGIVELRA
jgi:predicted nuclease of predicted toxin-antitoxin system